MVFSNFNRGYSLPQAALSFTAELSAIIVALKLVFVHQGNNYTLFIDSQGALLAIESFNSHPLVLAILEWLFLIHLRRKKVNFYWIPTHVGIRRNERVDALAKAVAVHPTGRLLLFLSQPLTITL